ncbi:MAG TPA: hypothetical protein VGC62_16330 [Pseudomonas sp.]|uniref:hypothetical protein n=1 Tax=Pseudomonas sp. TaxID=306 RepID=UPI002ED8DDDB
MAVSNIEKFDDYAGKIFAELYQQFPRPCTLTPKDFIEVAEIWDERLEMTLPTDDAEFFIATGNWLIQAGYVFGGKRVSYQISDAVLTPKGLEILKATPDSVNGKASLGEALISSVAEGGKDVTKGLVSQAFGLGARYLTPIIGPMVGLS